MKILVCMLEFPTWELAKPWSYISGYAFVDALRDAGHEVELRLLFNLDDASAAERVMRAYAEAGAAFDCAFFWMPHIAYSATFWRLAERVAPRRVAFLIESLRYTRAEIRGFPDLAAHYAERAKLRPRWLGWLRRCTHVVTMDHHDFRELARAGYQVFWLPGIVPAVPEAVLEPFEAKSPTVLTAATIYGKRRQLHRALTERGIVDSGERLQHSPELIAAFERAVGALRGAPDLTGPGAAVAADEVRHIRKALWHEYLRHVSRFAAVISLPAYFKGFPGRVFEGMIAGCAVFVCEPFDLARQKKVFLPETHIHYLHADPTEAEIARIVQVARDPAYRWGFAAAVRERARQHCDSRVVAANLMSWIDSDDPTAGHGLLARMVRRLRRAARRAPGHVEVGYETN